MQTSDGLLVTTVWMGDCDEQWDAVGNARAHAMLGGATAGSTALVRMQRRVFDAVNEASSALLSAKQATGCDVFFFDDVASALTASSRAVLREERVLDLLARARATSAEDDGVAIHLDGMRAVATEFSAATVNVARRMLCPCPVVDVTVANAYDMDGAPATNTWTLAREDTGPRLAAAVERAAAKTKSCVDVPRAWALLLDAAVGAVAAVVGTPAPTWCHAVGVNETLLVSSPLWSRVDAGFAENVGVALVGTQHQWTPMDGGAALLVVHANHPITRGERPVDVARATLDAYDLADPTRADEVNAAAADAAAAACAAKMDDAKFVLDALARAAADAAMALFGVDDADLRQSVVSQLLAEPHLAQALEAAREQQRDVLMSMLPDAVVAEATARVVACADGTLTLSSRVWDMLLTLLVASASRAEVDAYAPPELPTPNDAADIAAQGLFHEVAAMGYVPRAKTLDAEDSRTVYQRRAAALASFALAAAAPPRPVALSDTARECLDAYLAALPRDTVQRFFRACEAVHVMSTGKRAPQKKQKHKHVADAVADDADAPAQKRSWGGARRGASQKPELEYKYRTMTAMATALGLAPHAVRAVFVFERDLARFATRFSYIKKPAAADAKQRKRPGVKGRRSAAADAAGGAPVPKLRTKDKRIQL